MHTRILTRGVALKTLLDTRLPSVCVKTETDSIICTYQTKPIMNEKSTSDTNREIQQMIEFMVEL